MTTKTLGDKLKQLKDKDIIIAADKFVSTSRLNKVLIELNKNKISNVTLLTNEFRIRKKITINNIVLALILHSLFLVLSLLINL